MHVGVIVIRGNFNILSIGTNNQSIDLLLCIFGITVQDIIALVLSNDAYTNTLILMCYLSSDVFITCPKI